MTGVITWFIDCGDGVRTEEHSSTTSFQSMINNELTLNQLRSVSGAGTKTHWKNPSYNLKELADSGELFKKMKYIPGEMYRFIPGDMY